VGKLRFTDDVTTSVGFQVVLLIGAVANAVVLFLYFVEEQISAAGILLRVAALVCPLLMLIAGVNGRRYRRHQEDDRR
jgi:uncharacterized PurR-regulated membrane protein YhhQ (DUF165 family)